jgi:hypothetical protein
MFENMGFDEAFGHGEEYDPRRPLRPLRRRKTLKEKLGFWGINLVFAPLLAICILSVSAEGLRATLPALGIRLARLPLPGADNLAHYSGWSTLDVAMLFALVLAIAVTITWVEFFSCLLGSGSVAGLTESQPVIAYLLAAIACVVVGGDAAIFLVGLNSKVNAWGGTPTFVPLLATTVYMSLVALLAWLHADYRASGTV